MASVRAKRLHVTIGDSHGEGNKNLIKSKKPRPHIDLRRNMPEKQVDLARPYGATVLTIYSDLNLFPCPCIRFASHACTHSRAVLIALLKA